MPTKKFWKRTSKNLTLFTPEEEAPTHIVEVHVPAGTSLFKGRIGSNQFGNLEGAIQYETDFFISKEFYFNPKQIDGVVDKIGD